MKVFSQIIGWVLVVSTSLQAYECRGTFPDIILAGKHGGTLEGKAWYSRSLKGKVTMLFYVDPDKRDLNDAFGKQLRKSGFDRSQFQTVVIINLAATWMPDALIESALKSKQKQFPEVIYIKDKDKTMVHQAGFRDDAYVVVLLDTQGKCVLAHTGKVDKKMAKKFILHIRRLLR